ncbi:MAG: AAA family ATPase [Caldilineaceae bacterium]
MSTNALPFTELAPGVAVGTPAPAPWRPLAAVPLLIIVGVTGVGKSTTLQNLAKQGFTYTLLPNRRVLTDQLIISYMQAQAGQPVQPVTDRKLRFDYTRRYREQFSGGMSQALTQLWLDPQTLGSNLIFDGLRGADEVGHAVQTLPLARFIVLNAPDVVRVQRLLGRNDAFDQIGNRNANPVPQTDLASFAALGLPEASALFNQAEEQRLLALVQPGEVTAEDLRAKLQIVVEERRNYDPAAAITILQSQAPDRTLVIDTTQNSPGEVVTQIMNFVKSSQGQQA